MWASWTALMAPVCAPPMLTVVFNAWLCTDTNITYMSRVPESPAVTRSFRLCLPLAPPKLCLHAAEWKHKHARKRTYNILCIPLLHTQGFATPECLQKKSTNPKNIPHGPVTAKLLLDY